MKTKQLDKQLAKYSATAGAVLAGATGADAAVHYTATNVVLDADNTSYGIDFDGLQGAWGQGGFTDIIFNFRATSSGSIFASLDRMHSAVGYINVYNLKFGDFIGVKGNLTTQTLSGEIYDQNFNTTSWPVPWESAVRLFDVSSGGGHYGSFSVGNVGGVNGYIGIEFSSPAAGAYDNFYGWVQIGEIASDYSSYTITGYAYEDNGPETTAGAVPEPSSLALLAMGAAGIRFLRKRYDQQ